MEINPDILPKEYEPKVKELIRLVWDKTRTTIDANDPLIFILILLDMYSKESINTTKINNDYLMENTRKLLTEIKNEATIISEQLTSTTIQNTIQTIITMVEKQALTISDLKQHNNEVLISNRKTKIISTIMTLSTTILSSIIIYLTFVHK